MKKASSYKVHIFSSIIAFILTLMIINFLDITINYLYLSFICIVYSLLPDIDTHKSVIWKIISAVLIILAIILWSYIFALLFLLCILIVIFLKHRGFTHTFISALLFSLPLLFFGIELFIGAFLSYLSHLIVDNKISFM